METISELDRAALQRSIDLILEGSDRDRAYQIRDMLSDGDHTWFEVASFASYVRQCEHLQLSPWEEPPCHVDEDDIDAILSREFTGVNINGTPRQSSGSAKLAKKMLAAGLSLYVLIPLDVAHHSGMISPTVPI